MSKLAEPVAQNLLILLQSNMEAAVAKIVNEYQDDVPLPVIDQGNYHFGAREDPAELPLPAVIVDPVRSTLPPGEFSNAWADYQHVVHIDVVIQSDREDYLTRSLLRYARAIWEVLYGNQDLLVSGVPFVISVRPSDGFDSPLVAKGDGTFCRGWRWVLDVSKYDDLS